MAEFCVECMRKECEEFGEPFAERGWIISEDADLCENCGEMKHVLGSRLGVCCGLLYSRGFPFSENGIALPDVEEVPL